MVALLVPATPGPALAHPPDFVTTCQLNYAHGLRADGSFFSSAAKCISYVANGGTPYYPSLGGGTVAFYGDPALPNYALDASGNPVRGSEFSATGESWPPNIPMQIGYQLPDRTVGTLNFVTDGSGFFFQQIPGIQIYHADGTLWVTIYGTPLLAVPCSQSGNGTYLLTFYTAFGRFPATVSTTEVHC